MNKFKIAFFGAPIFAARVLQQIIDDAALPAELICVVTQPDRPAGRKQELTPTPVKTLALKNNVEVMDDFQLSTLDLRLKEVDLVLLYAFGQFIPAEMLKIPKWGFWNIHPSLLPTYRNTSPIAYALLLGDKTTGVSLIQMDEKLDHGPIIMQEKYEILNEDTREDLENKLSDIGYKIFKQSVQNLLEGSLQRHEQNHDKRTFTRLLTKQDGFLPLDLVQKIIHGESLENEALPNIIQEYYKKYPPLVTSHQPLATYQLFRALSPWPGLWTLLPNGKRLKITSMALGTNHYPLITHLQLEGKTETTLETFLSGHPDIFSPL